MFKLISPFTGTHTIWLAPMIRLPQKSVQSYPDTQQLPDSNIFTWEMQNKQCRNKQWVGSQNEGCEGSHLSLPHLGIILFNLQDYFQYLNRMHPP